MTKVIVLTSQMFENQIGTVTEINKTTITVDFDGKIGKYNIQTNRFKWISDEKT